MDPWKKDMKMVKNKEMKKKLLAQPVHRKAHTGPHIGLGRHASQYIPGRIPGPSTERARVLVQLVRYMVMYQADQ